MRQQKKIMSGIYPFHLKILDFRYRFLRLRSFKKLAIELAITRFLKLRRHKNQVAKKPVSSGGMGIFIALLGMATCAYSDDDAVKKLQELNQQIQSQLQHLQTDQQNQMKTMNQQLQDQIKQSQSKLETQIQTVNAQLKKIQADLQKQIKELESQTVNNPAP